MNHYRRPRRRRKKSPSTNSVGTIAIWNLGDDDDSDDGVIKMSRVWFALLYLILNVTETRFFFRETEKNSRVQTTLRRFVVYYNANAYKKLKHKELNTKHY